MDASAVELSVTVPREPRFAAMVARVAEHAAQSAGYADSDARAFGRSVDEAVRGCMAHGGNGELTIVVRQTSNAVEILVSGQTLTLQR